MSEGSTKSSAATVGAGNRGHAVVDVALYSAARFLLVAVITAIIYAVARLSGLTEFPLVVAALFGLIIAMPLGVWVFSPLRRRANEALAAAGERRRAERSSLRARLRGPDMGTAASEADPAGAGDESAGSGGSVGTGSASH